MVMQGSGRCVWTITDEPIVAVWTAACAFTALRGCAKDSQNTAKPPWADEADLAQLPEHWI